MDRAESGTYGMQWYSIAALGSLLVEEARPVLEKISRESGDNDMRAQAEESLARIRRVAGFKGN
jgi:hypothetical protein